MACSAGRSSGSVTAWSPARRCARQLAYPGFDGVGMYVIRTKRTNRDGSTVAYLRLAHNEQHPVTGNPVAKVIWSFGREDSVDVERAIFAMTANRALAPWSKRAMEDWVENDVCIDGLEQVQVHQLYRAMDLLIGNNEHIQDLVGWKLGWALTVVDRGFSFAANLRCLQRAGGH